MQLGKATPSRHLPESVRILVAPGTLPGDVRSPASDLWKRGREKASTRSCQATRCHGLFLKPQKAPHPFYSSLFPHQPCVRRSWGMDLGKPCHLHLNGTWGSSGNLPGNGATPAQLRPAGEDRRPASSSHKSTRNCRDGRTDGWMSHLWEAHS